MVGNGRKRSELVGILEVIKNKFSFVYLRFSDFSDISDRSDMSEKVGIGRNPWSEMSGAQLCTILRKRSTIVPSVI